MRIVRLIAVALALIAAAPAPARTPQFELDRNATLETLQIMVLLAPSWKVPNVGVRPLADKEKAHFARYASHPSIQLLDKMMRAEGSGWINWLQILNIMAVSSEKPVPHASFDRNRIGFPDFEFPKQNIASAVQLMNAVNQFYRDAHVENFLHESRLAYDCAFAEVQKDLPPPSLLSAMERYYGTSLSRYAVLPSPLENNFVDMNVRVNTPQGIQTFMIVAPNRHAKTAEEYGCGFEEGKDTKWLVIHEFGHSFVNPLLEAPAVKTKINQYAHLYSPIKDEQTSQGMPEWFGTVIEHVVRLGEIRILESVGDRNGAQQRRLDYVFDRDFVYLPLLEDRIKEYEADRTKYATFQSFIDRLIGAFSDEQPVSKQ